MAPTSRARAAVLAVVAAVGTAAAWDQMNGDYAFANQLPGTKAQHRGSGYFVVETEEINSTYAQVNWRTHQMPIDPDTVAKLKGKLVNFVGYEFDIRKILPNGTETSARAWEQYNHHYGNTVIGSAAKLVKTGLPYDHEPMAQHDDASKQFPGYRIVNVAPEGNLRQGAGAPYASQALVMGNGAEARKTFHYLPPGYAASVRSPYQVVMHPMIIDTANRDPSSDFGTDPEHTRHGIVPPQANVGPGAMYSGLMECPCTDHYPKKMSSYSTLKSGTCNPLVETETDCVTAATELGLVPIVNTSTISNSALPTGCSVQPTVGGFDVVFNTASNGSTCGDHKAQGPVLPQTCNISGTWTVINRHGKKGPNEQLVFAPAAGGANGYTVHAVNGGALRALLNVTTPTVTNPQGVVDGVWLSQVHTKPNQHLTAPLSTYTTTSPESVPPCTRMDWSNGVEMVKNPYSTLPYKAPPVPRVTALGEDLVNITVDVDAAKDTVTIALTGPADVWYGVGLGAASHAADPSDPSTGLSMLGTNWTVVVLGNGTVQERRLGNHEAGELLIPTVTVVNNTVKNGVRTVVMTRSLEGPQFTFDPNQNSIAFINAIGSTPDFAYHKEKSSAIMYFVETDAPTCICDIAADQGTLGGFAWGSQRCLPRPLGQMLDDPGWRNITGGINPTCSLKYYKGGLRCCKDGSILLNSNQTVSTEPYTYKLRYRYYYDIVDESETATPLADTFVSSWWTEHLNNEHDVPPCYETNKSKCVYAISSNFTAGMLNGCGNGCKMIHMEGHCHIGCLKMELWIMDDPQNPKLVCRTNVTYGTGDSWMNEEGYIGGNQPCIFGNPSDGFEAPIPLKPTTKLMSIKYQNNTHVRYGDMALWELRGVTL